jgi:hypothetical protein
MKKNYLSLICLFLIIFTISTQEKSNPSATLWQNNEIIYPAIGFEHPLHFDVSVEVLTNSNEYINKIKRSDLVSPQDERLNNPNFDKLLSLLQNPKDLLNVIKSMNNSLVFQKNIPSNVKGIYIRSINGKHVDLNNQNLTVNNTKVFQFDRGLKTNMENYLIFDCEIMYSISEINIQFFNKDFENKEKLTIKLIN